MPTRIAICHVPKRQLLSRGRLTRSMKTCEEVSQLEIGEAFKYPFLTKKQAKHFAQGLLNHLQRYKLQSNFKVMLRGNDVYVGKLTIQPFFAWQTEANNAPTR